MTRSLFILAAVLFGGAAFGAEPPAIDLRAKALANLHAPLAAYSEPKNAEGWYMVAAGDGFFFDIYLPAGVTGLKIDTDELKARYAKAEPPAIAKKHVCICGDSCRCKPGDCPGKCPLGNADDAYAVVAKGKKVVLCVGVPAIEGAYVTGPKKGITNGVYDCSREDGVNVMRLRPVATVGYPASVYGFANPFVSPCAGGNCPAPTTMRRR